MPRRRPVPFLAHQLLEYLVAGSLASLSVHINRSGLLLGAAVAFALLAVTAHGPLGLARLCGPRLHATLDIVVALAVAAAPILPALRPDNTGIAVVEIAALAWVRVTTMTRYTPDADADVDSPRGTGGAVVARALGILTGRSVRRLPESQEKVRGGARHAGRHAARLQRAWRKPPA